jgi:valyl-tRNA synthetase
MQMEANEKMEFKNESIIPKTLADQWILARFSIVAKELATALETFQISTAGDTIYHFVWDEFCAWYLEAFKADPSPEFLVQIFREILKLTHPICPYITEHLWRELFPSDSEKFVVEQNFPSVEFMDATVMKKFEFVQTAVTKLRRVRADAGVNPKDTIEYSIATAVDRDVTVLIELLAKVKNVSGETLLDNATKIQVGGTTFLVDFPVDEAKQARVKAALEKKISALTGRLSNKKYVDSAPEKLVNQTRDQLVLAQAQLSAVPLFLMTLSE